MCSISYKCITVVFKQDTDDEIKSKVNWKDVDKGK